MVLSFTWPGCWLVTWEQPGQSLPFPVMAGTEASKYSTWPFVFEIVLVVHKNCGFVYAVFFTLLLEYNLYLTMFGDVPISFSLKKKKS